MKNFVAPVAAVVITSSPAVAAVETSSPVVRTTSRLGKWTRIALVSTVALLGSKAYAFDPQRAVQESIDLQDTATSLATDVMNGCGCRNTANILTEIASLSVDIEMEARFGTAKSTAPYLKKVLYKVKSLKSLVPHIRDKTLRLRVKREISLAVNQLGRNIMGKGWSVVHCFAFASTDFASSISESEFQGEGVASLTCPNPENEDAYTDNEMDAIIDNINSEPSED